MYYVGFPCLNKSCSENASDRFHHLIFSLTGFWDRGNFAGHALKEVSRSPTAIICRKPRGSGSSGELFQLDIDKLTNLQRWFPPRREFFSRRIRNGYTVLVLSWWRKERGGSHPLFGSNVPLRTSTRVQTRFHASDVDLVARLVKRELRYIRQRV